MSLLANLATDASIADEKDSVGMASGPLESGVYKAVVQTAYVTKSQGGATGLVINAKTDAGREIRQTFWMTSGTAKGGKNYYEKDGQKSYLPGFIAANALSRLTTAKEISELDTEVKVINVYNRDAKAEVPTKVDMVMDLIGKEVLVGLLKQKVDKNAKNETTGVYEPTGETREENEVDKFFRASDRKTTSEILTQAEEATFIDTWSKKWTGVTRDKSKGTSAAAGTAGLPKLSTGGAPTKKPTTSLFA